MFNPIQILKMGLVALVLVAIPAAYFLGRKDGVVKGNEQALKEYIETIGDINEVTAPDDPTAVLRELCELADFVPDRCSNLRGN